VKNPDEPAVIDLLLSGSRKTLEYTLTLINALSSECLGRGYLLQKSNLVDSLVQVLFAETTDSILRQNVLGTLQKFSLRRRP
jgi:LisH domain-containing protein ARMC9